MSNLQIPDAPELTHDRLADQFDAVMNQYDLQRRLEVLIDEFLEGQELRGQRVLDAGCGTGHGTKRLAERGANVVAVDIGKHLLKHTRQRTACLPVQSSILTLPFASNSFRVVFSTEVIEHTPAPIEAVRELWRVVEPGGMLVLSTPNALWQFPVRLASWLKIRPYDGLENFVRPSALRASLDALGGKFVDHRGIHLLPFQISFLHPFLRYADRYGQTLLPLMINQAIAYRK